MHRLIWKSGVLTIMFLGCGQADQKRTEQRSSQELTSVSPQSFKKLVCEGITGFPFLQALKLPASAVQKGWDILSNPADQTCWANTVMALGVLGKETDIIKLINLLEQGLDGELNADEIRMMIMIPYALAHASGVHPSSPSGQTAADYLIKASDVSYWPGKLSWTYGKKPLSTHKKLSSAVVGAMYFSRSMKVKEQLTALANAANVPLVIQKSAAYVLPEFDVVMSSDSLKQYYVKHR